MDGDRARTTWGSRTVSLYAEPCAQIGYWAPGAAAVAVAVKGGQSEPPGESIGNAARRIPFDGRI